MKSFNQTRVDFTLLCLAIYLFIESDIVLGSLRCEREQSSPINQVTILDCTITGSYYGVYWYIGESRDSIIRYINGQKAGSEYQSGKLDIASNGSMIINNVSVNDEGTYRVMVVWREGGDDSEHVDLSVIVPSSRHVPEIDRCNDTESCHICIYQSVALNCSMDGRPPVVLNWYNITSGIPLDNQNCTSVPSFQTFVSYCSIEVHMEYQEVTEIECVPSGPAVTLLGSVVRNASVLLITPSDPYVYLTETFYVHVSNFPNVIGQNIPNTVAWIKQTSNVDYSYKPPTCEALRWSENGTLPPHRNNNNVEGIYTQVVKKDGETFERSVYEVRQAIPPEHSHVFEECLSQDPQNCSIYVNGTGKLTCLVTNSRPAGEITWNVTKSGPQITRVSSIHSCEHEIGLCETSVTITFRFTSAQVGVGEFECKVNGPWNEFPLSATVKVFNNHPISTEYTSTEYTTTEYTPAEYTSSNTHSAVKSTQNTFSRKRLSTNTQSSDNETDKGQTNWIAPVVIACIIVFLVFLIIVLYKNKICLMEKFSLLNMTSLRGKASSSELDDHPKTSKHEVEKTNEHLCETVVDNASIHD